MIVVTGFERFGREEVNPTATVVRELDGRVLYGEKVRGLILPVSFKKSRRLVEEIVKERPSLLLSLGLASRSTCVKLEVVALNVAHSEKGDNDGYRPFNEPIYEDGDLAYRGTIPFERILRRLRRSGVPSALSFHAGTFLCNYVYYVALYNARKSGTRVGFMHIPHLTEYAVKRPEVPSLPKDLVIKAVRIAVEESLRQGPT